MSKFYKSAFSTLLISACLMSTAALADSVVNVRLNDNGMDMDLSKSMGMGMGKGMMVNMMHGPMSITITPNSVSHGTVKFNVTNASKSIIHEMILSPLADESKPLAYIDRENRVDEEASIHLGEVSELDPGKSGTLILDVKPGKYILYCNLPGHITWRACGPFLTCASATDPQVRSG